MSHNLREVNPRERVSETLFALAFLVTAAGALLLVAGLAFRTRASVLALGIILVVLGAAMAVEVGVRPARRRGRPVFAALRSGLGRLRRGARWLVGGRPQSETRRRGHPGGEGGRPPG